MKSSVLGTFTAFAGIILLALAGPVTAQRPTKTFAKRGLGAGDSFPFEDADAKLTSMSMMSESSLVAAPTKDDDDSSPAPSKLATKAQKSTKASKSTKSQPTVPTHVHQDFWADHSIVDLTFEAMDVNSDGMIEEGELSKSLNMMAAKEGLPPALISGMFKAADSNGDDKIDPHEFALIAETTQSPCTATEKIVSVGTAYACGDSASPTTNTKVYIPGPNAESGFEKYPVVLFHRGSSGWDHSKDDPPGYGYDKWLRSITKQCVIVIAPMTSKDKHDSSTRADCLKDRDLLNVYKYAKIKANWDNWGIGVTPDWERLGGVGHSSGGHHLPQFQMDLHNLEGSPKLSAAVYSHAGGTAVKHIDLQKCLELNDPYTVTVSPCAGVPSFFLTQNQDGTVKPEWTYSWFELLRYQTRHNVFAEIGEGHEGKLDPIGHMEPVTTSLLGAHTGRFLACHLFDYNGKYWTDDDPIRYARYLKACSGVYSYDPDHGGRKICNAVKGLDIEGKAAGICEVIINY